VSNAKRRHRRRRRFRRRQQRAIRAVAELAAEWVERELAEGATFVGWLHIRPMGSDSEIS
jgi:hypothetical protein